MRIIEPYDFAAIEDLLKQGADPLGPSKEFGWDLLEHIYGDTVLGYSDCDDSPELPQLTELFLKYGMDIGKPRIPYDSGNSINPTWHIAHLSSKDAALALKMLLDAGLSSEDFAEFWDNALTDYFYVECGDPQNDEFWNNHCTWTFRMLLLGASYDHILDKDEYLREFICCSSNSYDVHMFRRWQDYEYRVDTSHCRNSPTLYGSIIRIYEKESGEEVWRIGVGKDGRETLKSL